jgi:hypothetical protein
MKSKTNVKGKRIFLSGPMSFKENYNVEAFVSAHATLKLMGAKSVYDPALVWLNEECETRTHEEYVRDSIVTLVMCPFDMFVTLDGWETSDGAYAEHVVAVELGIDVVPYKSIATASATTVDEGAAHDEA